MSGKAEVIGGPFDGLVMDYLGPSLVIDQNEEGDNGLRAARVPHETPAYFAKRAPDLSGPTVGRRYVYAPMVIRQRA